MYNVKTKVIPIAIGATGTISISFRKYMNNVSAKHEIMNYRTQSYWAIKHSGLNCPICEFCN
jgi:hypothetical protein